MSLLLAVSALVTGLIAAWKWYEASNVTIDLGYVDPSTPTQGTYKRAGLNFPRQPQSGDPEMQRMAEIAATWEAVNEAARLNKVAAIWTGAATAISAAASILGTFSN